MLCLCHVAVCYKSRGAQPSGMTSTHCIHCEPDSKLISTMTSKSLLIFCDGTGMDGNLAPQVSCKRISEAHKLFWLTSRTSASATPQEIVTMDLDLRMAFLLYYSIFSLTRTFKLLVEGGIYSIWLMWSALVRVMAKTKNNNWQDSSARSVKPLAMWVDLTFLGDFLIFSKQWK